MGGATAWLEECLSKVERKNVRDALDAYALLIRKCGTPKSLPDAKRVHNHLVERGFSTNPALSDLLVQMYSKCRSLEDARSVFDSLPKTTAPAWNFLIRGYALCGQGNEAFRLYREMETRGLSPDWYAFSSVLKLCPQLSTLEEAKQIHARAEECGMASDILVVNTLITMYAKFKEVDRARQVFEGCKVRELFTWNAMIIAYAQDGHPGEALQVYNKMDVEPDRVTLSCVLGACSSLGALEEGKKLHARADSLGFRSDLVVQTALVNFYGKCGVPATAREIFDRIPQKSVVSWNSMMGAYVANGYNREAVQLYERMVLEGCKPSSSSFTSVLHACANLQDFEKGKAIHQQIIACGYATSNIVVETALVSFYGRCNKLEVARALFDEVKEKNNVIAFNAMMAAYAVHGHWKEALEIYKEMTVGRGVQPDVASFVTALSVCWSMEQLQEGKMIHASIRQNSKARAQVNVQNALLSMYSRCGSLDCAKSIFDNMKQRDSVSWNAMVVAYVQHGHCGEALETFENMVASGFEGDAPSFSSAMFACSLMGDVEQGQNIHHRMLGHSKLRCDLELHISLINMYTDCGSLELARQVFESVSSRDSLRTWNAIIMSYAKYERGRESLLLLKRMQLQGVRPAGTTLATVLGVCWELREGKAVHALVMEGGSEEDLVVCGSLVTMYARCHRIELAAAVFEGMEVRNAVCWTCMMSAYLMEGLAREVIKLYHRMDIEPDDVTLAVVFGACTSLGDLKVGSAIHKQVVDKEMKLGLVGSSGLVNMYAKCGKLDIAREVFEKMEAGTRTYITWSTIIAGYAQHSQGPEALKLFKRMLLEGVWPDAIAFVSLLISSSQEGKVEAVRGQFVSMVADFGIIPMVDHYNCIIDVLGRSGWIREAEELVDSMPFEPRVMEWTTLLSACRTHVDVERGWRAAECAFELQPEDTSLYVLLANMHAAAGIEVEDVETMKKRLANKEFARRTATSIVV